MRVRRTTTFGFRSALTTELQSLQSILAMTTTIALCLVEHVEDI